MATEDKNKTPESPQPESQGRREALKALATVPVFRCISIWRL